MTQRRALGLELAIVLVVTFGVSAVIAILRLIDSVLHNLGKQTVALNPRRSSFELVDLGLNLALIAQLLGWGALGVYLLWRSGFAPAAVGLGRLHARPDVLGGVGLAALIGLPGLALYVGARYLELDASVVPSEPSGPWWRMPVLVVAAFTNGWAEEVIVVAYLLTRLRQLGISGAGALACSGLLRGAYHLYQGFGAGLGNLVMGLVFGYVWQRTGRLWPLVVAHGLIDTVAFVSYPLLHGHLGWLS